LVLPSLLVGVILHAIWNKTNQLLYLRLALFASAMVLASMFVFDANVISKTFVWIYCAVVVYVALCTNRIERKSWVLIVRLLVFNAVGVCLLQYLKW